MARQTQQNWTPAQIKHQQFVARGKTNKKGESRTDEQFAKALGVDRVTVWRWMQLPGYKQAIIEMVLADQVMPDLPLMINGQKMLAKGVTPYALDSKGNRKTLKPNTNAFNALIKLMGLVTPQQVESTVTADVSHRFEEVSDAELDRIIESGGVLSK